LIFLHQLSLSLFDEYNCFGGIFASPVKNAYLGSVHHKILLTIINSIYMKMLGGWLRHPPNNKKSFNDRLKFITKWGRLRLPHLELLKN
jgi:hypothetical protein